MQIGYSTVDITPNIGVELAGYIGKRESVSIHSSLYARVVAFREDEKTSIWITLDLIAIDHVLIQRLRNEIEKQNLAVYDLQVFATHTHSGCKGVIDLPALASIFGEVDTVYLDKVAKQCVQAIQEAMLDLDECKVSMNQRNLIGFAASRHDASIEINNTLTTLLIERKNRKDILLYHFACHPTILHADNVAISSDFVGGVKRQLEDKYENVVFLNGSCGNISTRFTRKGSSFEEVNRMGALVAKQILEAVDSCVPMDCSMYKAVQFTHAMKKRAVDSLEEANLKIKQSEKHLQEVLQSEHTHDQVRLAQSYLEGAQANYQFALYNSDSKEEEIQVSLIQLGGLHIIGIPGELFHSLEQRLDETNFICVNYANGYHAYIADKDAYDKGYYESLTSYYERGEGERLMDAIRLKMKEMNKSDSTR